MMSSYMASSPATTSRAAAQLRLMGQATKATRPILRSAEEAERHLARLLTNASWLISTCTGLGPAIRPGEAANNRLTCTAIASCCRR